jgi:DNA-binding SARP family transcriptional activator
MRLSAAVVALDAGTAPDGVRRAFDADLDEWGAALFSLHAGMAAVAAQQPAVVLLDEAAERLRFLGAEVLELWARAHLAVALVAAGDRVTAIDTARSVVDAARRAAAPAVVAFAQVAAARAASGAEAVAWVQRATATAAQHGLPLAAPTQTEARPASVVERVVAPVLVQLFGGFRLEVDGSPVDLGHVKPRARAALRLLALHAPSPVHREALCASLWPEADADAATRNLQVAISSLRQVLEPGVARGSHALLVRDGDAYRLNLPDGAVVDLVSVRHDLAAARRALGEQRLADAAGHLVVALDAGAADLLPEDGPADWVVAERDVVRASLVDAASRLAALALKLGEPEIARDAAERGLRVDRFRDELWRSLADAHRATGDAAAAARAEHEYATVLAELGLT